jgi:F-type H+-transporting ATPase subunit a
VPHDQDNIDIVHHLVDQPTYWWGLDLTHLGITKHVWMMWIACAVLIVAMNVAARQRGGKGDPPGGLRKLFEPIILFIRDAVVIPNMGQAGLPFLPFLVTLFLFILVCNLLGLVPGQATATANISVTATLAIMSALVTHGAGIRRNGVVKYMKSIVPHVPWGLWPLMLVVELIGFVAKPFALAIRLWANMNAGHVVILILLGFIFIFKSWPVVGISVVGVQFIYALELFVAVLQAYVFTFLTAVFMGLALHPEH